MSNDTPLNIFGIPYDFFETIRWILKHTFYDLLYPFVLAIVGLTYFEFTYPYLTLFGICVAFVILSYIIFYWIRSVRTKEENIGKYDNERKWSHIILNPIDEKNVIYEIGFVGDIMKMKDYTLDFKGIEKFFEGVDLIVGNLEGVIKDNKSISIVRQKHRSEIINNLTEITKNPPNWLLCISNNHSADFKEKYFYETRNFIDKRCGFKAFGYKGCEYYSPVKGINIVSGTMWNNYKNDYASQFINVNSKFDPDSFNILYPHWHYENECYIRSKIKERTIELMKEGIYKYLYKHLPKKLQRAPIKNNKGKLGITVKWDLIFGHHTHVPQPIVGILHASKLLPKKLLAYSGGNFTSSKWINKHQHGLILRCQIAKKNKVNSFVIRRIDWSYTECERDRKKRVVKVNIDVKHNRLNSYDFRETKILMNLFVVSLFYLLVTPLFSIVTSIPILSILEIFIKSISIIGVQFSAVWVISRMFFKYKKPKPHGEEKNGN
ncbi:MAG: CapA family protein [Candidatus Lokiarchaeota archaeon]|nr:CapA family protein [Candidatus Lokiarchaeota archaeon]